MSERQFDDSVVKADRWSKVVALFVAIGFFLLARELTADVQFSSVVAATAAIGARLYIPHYASMQVPEADRVPLSEPQTTGNYHHGAAGIALVTGSVVALGVFVGYHAFLTAIGVGFIAGVVCYVVVASWRPAD